MKMAAVLVRSDRQNGPARLGGEKCRPWSQGYTSGPSAIAVQNTQSVVRAFPNAMRSMRAGFRRHAASDGMQRAFGTPSPEVSLGQKFFGYPDPTTFNKMTRRPYCAYEEDAKGEHFSPRSSSRLGYQQASVTGSAVKHAVFVGPLAVVVGTDGVSGTQALSLQRRRQHTRESVRDFDDASHRRPCSIGSAAALGREHRPVHRQCGHPGSRRLRRTWQERPAASFRA
jgi:hypothetical protein